MEVMLVFIFVSVYFLSITPSKSIPVAVNGNISFMAK